MPTKTRLELRDLKIQLSYEDITALRHAIAAFRVFKDTEDILGVELPDEIGWRSIKLVLKSLRKDQKYLTSYSSRKKINRLPIDFVLTIIMLSVVHQNLAIDLRQMTVLMSLNAKMRSALEIHRSQQRSDQ